MKQEILDSIAQREATVGIVGLGYVGLPLLLEFAKAGFPVIGFDVDTKKTDALTAGDSYIRHIKADVIAEVFAGDRATATTDFTRMSDCAALLICVPTPLTEHRDPDLSYVENTATAMAPHLRKGQLVALESTIITHGMPYPDNETNARDVEQAVRDAGATPATIAVLDGRVKVGLSGRELARLAEMGADAGKCSLRDLPLVSVARQSAGTTVAATMFIAEKAGIQVFATGGIGGVHRGAASSMDVSADLEALARYDVAVVCAGPKAVLDLGLTMEYLETKGVPVIGYKTEQLPAFWSRDSGFDVDATAASPAVIADVLMAKRAMGLPGGIVVANPIPEKHAIPADVMNRHIGQALQQCQEASVSGKEITPYLLSAIEQLSAGQSLESNRALVINNARLAAQVAVELATK